MNINGTEIKTGEELLRFAFKKDAHPRGFPLADKADDFVSNEDAKNKIANPKQPE